jgi:hypothetical protein
MKSTVILVAVLLAALSLRGHAQSSIDWKAVQAETLQHFRALVQIDTSNPPGNETRAVDYLKRVLEKENIPVQIFSSDAAPTWLVATSMAAAPSTTRTISSPA